MKVAKGARGFSDFQNNLSLGFSDQGLDLADGHVSDDIGSIDLQNSHVFGQVGGLLSRQSIARDSGQDHVATLVVAETEARLGIQGWLGDDDRERISVDGSHRNRIWKGRDTASILSFHSLRHYRIGGQHNRRNGIASVRLLRRVTIFYCHFLVQ